MSKYSPRFPRIAQLKTFDQFRQYLIENEIALPVSEEVKKAALQSPIQLKSGTSIGNRFCILPMEGWDGTTDGRPTDLTRRRWQNFALSGAKLLWGCEAVAVRHEGRANPNQLLLNENNRSEFDGLFNLLRKEHQNKFGEEDDLHIGLQLTHSGRFSKPNDHHHPEPRIAYHHPILDKRFTLNEKSFITDEEIDELAQDYIQAAIWAQESGFHFVDIKHCHGYLGHELLSGYDRPGKYGGSAANRFRFLREIAKGIHQRAPGLGIGVRVSAFDFQPFKPGPEGIGIPEIQEDYRYAFGGDPSGTGINLDETIEFLRELESLGIELVCITAGSPYYNPHIIRPALFPPSDGYYPPEDPLMGVARQIQVTRILKKQFPTLKLIGSAYSYLQEWLPHVASAVIENQFADFIGLGRMVLSYPELPHDILTGHVLKRNKICRTFSDCTTAPRNGMISGCFPLDPFYKQMPEASRIKELKSADA